MVRFVSNDNKNDFLLWKFEVGKFIPHDSKIVLTKHSSHYRRCETVQLFLRTKQLVGALHGYRGLRFKLLFMLMVMLLY